MIAIIDFASQYTHLIAKNLRHIGVQAHVLSPNVSIELLKDYSAIILSGSPMSVGKTEVELNEALLKLKQPKLALCFGYQWAAQYFGGKIKTKEHSQYGEAWVEQSASAKSDLLLGSLDHRLRVWMSHGDSVVELPESAELLLSSQGAIAAFKIEKENLWALQFHPEVSQTEGGFKIIENFVRKIAQDQSQWSLKSEVELMNDNLEKQLEGVEKVYCAVSGGVDSTVLAAVLSRHVEVCALFVDHGFLREYDYSDIQNIFKSFPNVELKKIDAQKLFWSELNGVSDPEAKRKIIGRLFIEAFKTEIPKEQKIHFAQGTIFSDVIESAKSEFSTELIKSHHNVGGLPDDFDFELVEPLRKFFKDEVRLLGKELKISEEFLERHPFPGPGLAIRVIGELSPEKVAVLKKADLLFHREFLKRNLYAQTWQAFPVLLPIQSVGVQGDERSFKHVLCLRAVDSQEAMTAEVSEIPWGELKSIASILINEVPEINRVVYDITSKPPATIEWE